jgi:hypothetical protein
MDWIQDVYRNVKSRVLAPFFITIFTLFPPCIKFISKTLTQTFVWGYIRVNGALQNNTDLALELIEEMMEKAQQYQQIGPAPSFVNFRAVC